MKKIKVIICGFGQIGKMSLNHFAKTHFFDVVGVFDQNPELNNSETGFFNLRVSNNLDDCPIADIAVVTTVSSARGCEKLISELLQRNFSVVTTCEELFFPCGKNLELKERLNKIAKENKQAVLGTGINPGFLMDLLPVVLSTASGNIEHIRILRTQDASPRRIQFQKKIGAGLDHQAFELKKADGSLRHVGLTESIAFIAEAIGWKLETITEELAPVVSDIDINIPNALPVKAGQARGVSQLGKGFTKNGREVISLEFLAAIGEEKSFDQIIITGTPNINSTISGGLNGDQGTFAILASCIRKLFNSGLTGYITMLDLPPAGGLPKE